MHFSLATIFTVNALAMTIHTQIECFTIFHNSADCFSEVLRQETMLKVFMKSLEQVHWR